MKDEVGDVDDNDGHHIGSRTRRRARNENFAKAVSPWLALTFLALNIRKRYPYCGRGILIPVEASRPHGTTSNNLARPVTNAGPKLQPSLALPLHQYPRRSRWT